MIIKLTDYQVTQMVQLAAQRTAIDTRLSDLTKAILDANGEKTDSQVSFDMDKKVLTLEDKPKK